MTATTIGGAIAPAMADVKIRLDGLTKAFATKSGPFVALDPITLDVPSGCFFMIVGPSGCGKTTLLRILAGLERPSDGTVEITAPSAGRPSNSMVFQGDSLFPLDDRQSKTPPMGFAMRHRPKKEIDDIVDHYLARTGLAHF